MKKLFLGKRPIVMAVGFVFCLVFNLLSDAVSPVQATATQGNVTRQRFKDIKNIELQNDIAKLEKLIADQQKIISDIINLYTSKRLLSKEQRRLAVMYKYLAKMQKKLVKIQGKDGSTVMSTQSTKLLNVSTAKPIKSQDTLKQ